MEISFICSDKIDASDASSYPGLLKSSKSFVLDVAMISGPKGRLAAVYVLLGAVLEGVGLSLLVPLIGIIFESNDKYGFVGHLASTVFTHLSVSDQTAKLFVTLGMFGILMLARTFVITARDTAIFDVQRRFIDEQRWRITQNLAAIRWDRMMQIDHARITSLMGSEIQRLGIGVQLLLRAITAGSIAFAQIAIAFLLSPALSIIILIVSALGAWPLKSMLTRARNLSGRVADANVALLNSTTQFVSSIKLASSQALEARLMSETEQTLRDIGEAHLAYVKQEILTQAMIGGLGAAVAAGLLLLGYSWLRVPPPQLIALLLVVTRMVTPLGQIYTGAQQFSFVLAIYDRLSELSRELSQYARPKGAALTIVSIPPGPINFERVSFQHQAQSTGPSGVHGKGLLNLSLRIERQEFLGITGCSGVGKTTFADLLVGLYEPQSGIIKVGGRGLNESWLSSWQSELGYVSQDTILFRDTVRRNLSWTSSSVSEKELWTALDICGGSNFVRRLERGLDTVLTDNGASISGGERQRIALARALVRKPKLLVLDEATSAIDAGGEYDILNRLRSMSKRPTIVLISHRMKNLAVCDRVLRFESSGSHTVVREDDSIARSMDETIL